MITAAHWHVLLIYAGFTVVATVLALARRWLRPGVKGDGLWRKYPTYVLINLGFIAASWLPVQWNVLNAALSLLGGLASWEICRALGLWAQARDSAQPEATRTSAEVLFFRLLPFSSFFLIAAAGWLTVPAWFSVWLAVLLLFLLAAVLIDVPGSYSRRVAAIGAAVVYLPVCLAAFVWIRLTGAAGFAAVFLYITVATNDALAQITGELFGRRPLVPKISPAKTVEGAAGGMLFAAAMGLALSGVMGWSYVMGAIMGLVLGAAGLIGDLTASVWKRALGLKNFSSLLGAQGGVLDRFDGLIFAAPVFHLLMLLLR